MKRIKLLALTATLVPAITYADDFAPPPWLRTHPNAITAEWEFLTPANPNSPPDGPLSNVLIKGSGTAPGGTSALITGAGGLGWGIGDGDGGWFFPAGGDILFRVDNVVDLEPVKHIRVQVTHTPGLFLGIDPLAAFNSVATGSLPGPITTTPFDSMHTFFDWDMFPNPPWEDFRLLVSGQGEIDQVLIDTISIPEPTSGFMIVLAVFGAITARRGSIA